MAGSFFRWRRVRYPKNAGCQSWGFSNVTRSVPSRIAWLREAGREEKLGPGVRATLMLVLVVGHRRRHDVRPEASAPWGERRLKSQPVGATHLMISLSFFTTSRSLSRFSC